MLLPAVVTRVVAAMLAVTVTGCMTLGVEFKPPGRPVHHPIIGGVLADIGVGAIASRVEARVDDDDDEFPHVGYYIGGLLLVDAISAFFLHRYKQRHAPPKPVW